MSVIAPTPFPRRPARSPALPVAAGPLLPVARAIAPPTTGDRRRAGRSCGSCTACCTAPSIPELDKPMDAPCRHLKSAPSNAGAGGCSTSRSATTGGCGNYDNRPTVCRAFLCGWRLGLGEKLDRPDLIGVMIQPTRRSDGTPMLAFVEIRPGALDTRRAQALMVRWAAATENAVTVRRAQSPHFMTLPVTIERRSIPQTIAG